MIFKDSQGVPTRHKEATCILKPNSSKHLSVNFFSSTPGYFAGELFVKFNMIDQRQNAYKTKVLYFHDFSCKET